MVTVPEPFEDIDVQARGFGVMPSIGCSNESLITRETKKMYAKGFISAKKLNSLPYQKY